MQNCERRRFSRVSGEAAVAAGALEPALGEEGEREAAAETPRHLDVRGHHLPAAARAAARGLLSPDHPRLLRASQEKAHSRFFGLFFFFSYFCRAVRLRV